jgi:hypothetical protein
MGEGARILDELSHAQRLHIIDATNTVAAHVGGETLVAEYGEAFLQ